jgi:ABC-type transport system involved in cytochrome bd biosynthesis fused ATPase/permease subunit
MVSWITTATTITTMAATGTMEAEPGLEEETLNKAELVSAVGRDPQDNIIFYNGWHPKFENYNIVVFGRSGAGKSFLVKLLSGRSALVGIQTIIIDPQREYENEMTALGCPYISLSPGSG